jgi:hypothetical protein
MDSDALKRRLFEALGAKSLEGVEAVVDLGAPLNELNEEGLTPLGFAVTHGFVPGINYLLGLAETDANKGRADGYSPLMIAAEKNRGNSTTALLGYPSVDINYQGGPNNNTALHVALNQKSLKVVWKLLENPRLDVNISNGDGKTPLYLAAAYDHIDVTEALLNLGAKADVFGQKGPDGGDRTIFELAVAKRFNLPIINRMIINMAKYGATFNAPPPAPGEAKVAVRTLPHLRIHVYPRDPEAIEFFKAVEVPMTIPVQVHDRPNEEEQKTFLRQMFLIRDICTGLGPNYATLAFPYVSFYVTLTDAERLIGFMLVTFHKREPTIFLNVICTRNTVSGAGKLLMKFLTNITVAGEIDTVMLESVESAITFYESLGFKRQKPSKKQTADQLLPMVYTYNPAAAGAGAGASGAAGGAGASASGGRRRTRRHRKRKGTRKQASG